MNISNKIRIIRKAFCCTVEQFAEKMNVSRQTIHQWEAGKTYPIIEKIQLLSKIFEIPVSALVDDEYDLVIRIDIKKRTK